MFIELLFSPRTCVGGYKEERDLDLSLWELELGALCPVTLMEKYYNSGLASRVLGKVEKGLSRKLILEQSFEHYQADR